MKAEAGLISGYKPISLPNCETNNNSICVIDGDRRRVDFAWLAWLPTIGPKFYYDNVARWGLS